MSFIYDGNMTSPQELAKQRALYESMLQRGGAPASSIGEGLAVLGQALAGRMGLNKVKKAEAKNLAGANGIRESFLRRGQGVPVAAATPAAPGAAPAAAAPSNSNDFVSMISPAAQKVGAQIGVDPRIIVAQAALESNWGKSAPGNNFFGIKSHGKAGGQTFKTHEVINGKTVAMNDSFRRFASPDDAVAGYGEFLTTNKRYKPMLGAKGLEAQLAALGQSGYATDPNYTKKLSSIISKLPANLAGAPAVAKALAPAAAPGTNNGDYLAQFGIKSNNPGLMDQEVVPTSGPPNLGVAQAQPQKPMGMSFNGPQQMAPQMPAQAPQMAPQPASQIATGGAMPMPQKPMTAYQRMMQTSLGKEAGGLAAPPNRTLMASVMGQGDSIGLPPQNFPTPSNSGETAAMPAMAPGMASPAASPAAGGSRLAELESYIFDPYFSVLQETNPAAANVIMKQYEQEYARANTVPEQPKPTDDMREFELSQKDPAFRKYLEDMKRAGASSNNVTIGDKQIKLPDPDKGYMWALDPATRQPALDKEGMPRQVPIPGSPAAMDAQKMERSQSQKQIRDDIMLEDTQRAINQTERAQLPVTGLIGDWLKGVTPEGQNVAALLEGIKGNISKDALQAMRDASPTGGALGSVTEKELAMLQSAYGSLLQSQSKDQFLYNLDRLRGVYTEITQGPNQDQNLRRPNELQWEVLRKSPQQPSGAAQAAPAPVPAQQQAVDPTNPKPGDVVNGYRFKGGQRRDPNSWEKVQ
jgi:flagellum-specific peptidoglycan hydrolase FlgJ